MTDGAGVKTPGAGKRTDVMDVMDADHRAGAKGELMPTRTARTEWSGGLQDGSGKVTLSSSGVGSYDVSFPRRAADDAGGVTSPEELVAAAHSSCYSMALSNELTTRGGTVKSLITDAAVTLGPDRPAAFG